MVKSNDEIIEQFNKYVNMSVKELEGWLETEDAQNTGQKKEDGEAIGHER
jgi:Protein of unknown function (DUF3140)